MTGPRRMLAALALAALAAACASPTPAQPDTNREPTPGTNLEPAPALPTPPPAPPIAAPTQPEPPPPAPALPGRDPRSAVACSSDAECGWDDPCMPTRCVEPHPLTACDESSPPPGTCSCLAGTCTLKPHSPPPPTGTCEPRACVVDRAAGRCVADEGGVAPGLRFAKPVDVGPSCDCLRPDQGCSFQWFDPVPCRSDRDCWTSADPRRHPVARPRHLRGRDFRPCKDGTTAPKCGPAGHCVVGPAYGC